MWDGGHSPEGGVVAGDRHSVVGVIGRTTANLAMFWWRRVLVGLKTLFDLGQTDGGSIYECTTLLEGTIALAHAALQRFC